MARASSSAPIPGGAGASAGCRVNDIHSQLNETIVDGIHTPTDLDSLAGVVRRARLGGRQVCVSGGRHAMGGQQFAGGAAMIDTRAMNRILNLDPEKGTVDVQAGIQWPELIERLAALQTSSERPWGIIQKQTGADNLTVGGALAANIHGRGLRLKPMVGDVESFVMISHEGTPLHVSRSDNPDLFALSVGGYGLFGPIYSVTLRLASRTKLRRRVTVTTVEDLMPEIESRIAHGAVYGDFQFAIDNNSSSFLREGICSTYEPAAPEARIAPTQKALSGGEWERLVRLAHFDKRLAFETYREHYLKTDGQIYWSDTHQLSTYLDDYHEAIDRAQPKLAGGGAHGKGSEIISEVYVPREALSPFLNDVRREFRRAEVDVIYGTIRLIERDDETFLPWAKDRYACMVLNLHVQHTRGGIERARDAFRLLIASAIAHGGSYYLTYHKFATKEQLLACYPQFPHFLELKRRHDPDGLFQSDWYRHYARLFGVSESSRWPKAG